MIVAVPSAGHAATLAVTEQAATLLPESQVVSAFHHMSAVLLEDPTEPSLGTDV